MVLGAFMAGVLVTRHDGDLSGPGIVLFLALVAIAAWQERQP